MERAMVHCSAGMGRTGLLQSAQLMVRHGLTIDEAVRTVPSHADTCGAIRHPFEEVEEVVRGLLGRLA